MAVAIREKKAIRSEVAIAMRPDGTRVAFRPYPTPLIDKTGTLRGAINILIDISDEQSDALKQQAARCRRLANRPMMYPPAKSFAQWPTVTTNRPTRSATRAHPAPVRPRRPRQFLRVGARPLSLAGCSRRAFCGKTDVRQLTSPIRASTLTEPNPPR